MILFFWLDAQQAVAQSGPPTLSCRLDVPSVAVGGQAELLLEIQNVQNFYGYELTLQYNPNMVEILDGDPTRDQVNAQLGDFLSLDFLMLNEINQPGELLLNLMQIDPTPARSGSGILARIALIGRAAGLATFTLADVLLYDANGEEIAGQTQNCSLQIGKSAASTPTATEVPPTDAATPSPTFTPTSEPPTASPTPTTELPPAATASPPPAATPEPTFFTPTATATLQAAMIVDSPTPSATAPSLQPTATPPANIAANDGASVQAEAPTPTPQAMVVSAPTAAGAPASIAQAENNLEANVATSNDFTEPAPVNARSTDAFLWQLFLPYIGNGGDSGQTVQAASVAQGGSPPLGKVEPASSPFTAVRLQPARNGSGGPPELTDLYLAILLLGLFAVVSSGFALLVIIAYVLFVHSQLSQPDVVVPASRRFRSGKMHQPRRAVRWQA